MILFPRLKAGLFIYGAFYSRGFLFTGFYLQFFIFVYCLLPCLLYYLLIIACSIVLSADYCLLRCSVC